MSKICKATLVAVKEDYDKRVQIYIKKLYNKSFEQLTDKTNPMHTVQGVKFLNIKRSIGSSTAFSIEVNKEGMDKLIVMETYRAMKMDGQDENVLPPLPPASMLPGTPVKNDFDFLQTIEHRKKLKEQVDVKIQLLKNEELRTGESRAQLEQIASLKELSISLFKEIKTLEDNDSDTMAFIDNIRVDIVNMQNLLRNPTIENLEFVKKYVDMIGYMTSSQKGGFLTESFITLAKNNPPVHAAIVKAKAGLKAVEDDLKAEVELRVLEKIEFHLRQTEENKNAQDDFIKEEAKRLYDIQFASRVGKDYIGVKYYTRMDNQEEGEVITSVIKKAYDDAVRNNGKKGVEDKLLAKEKSITKRLMDTGNFIGTFFNKKADWSIFKTANKGESRLINVFTVGWQEFKKKNAIRQKSVTKISYVFTAENSDAQLNTIDKHYEDLSKEADFIDVRKLPEIIADSSFSEFSGNFANDQEALDYKQELIDRMGQREYNKLVKEAQDNISAFMIEKDVKLQRLLEEYGATNAGELQDKMYKADAENVWNFYLQNFYTKSPFVFAENHFDQATGNKVAKSFFIDGKQYINHDARANLEYSTFTPKDKHKDKRFEENIKSDPVLLEAWELMDELVEYSNLNGTNYKESTDLLTDLGHEKLDTHLLSDIVGLVSPKILKNIKRLINRFTGTISGKEYQSETGDRNITGSRITAESKIGPQYKKLLAIDGVSEKDLTPEKKQDYRERAVELVEAQENNDNLLHNIVTSSQTTGAFKAKKEVETFVNFMADQLRNVKDRQSFSEITDYFINKNLYGINNRGKVENVNFDFGKMVKHYPREHEEIRVEIKAGITALKKELKKDPGNATLEANIADLEVMKEDGVLYVNGRDISESILFKIKAFTAFAINGSAQVTNMAIASANAYEVDGKKGFWKAGVYTRAMSFSRKYKNVSAITSKKMQEQRQIMDMFLKSADLVQNSANEIYKKEASRYGSALKQIIKNPTNFVGEVEKTIQKPQLLALLSGVMVSDGKGWEVPLFDPSPKDGNYFPALNLVDGVLVLHKMFDTQANRNTFLNFNSQEAANLFGESGKLPKAIAYINGDYRNSTSYLAEKHIVTAMSLMFKRWAIATIYKKAGVYQRLAKNDQAVGAVGFQLLKGVLFASSVGSAGVVAGVSMPFVLAAVIGAYVMNNRKQFIKTVEGDTSVIKNIYKNTKEADLGLTMSKMLKGGLTTASLAISTGAHALLNIPSRFIGRDVIDSDKLKSLIYIDKKNLTSKTEDEIREDLYFLQTSTALVLRNMIYGLALHALYSVLDPGFDDDEEKEKYRLRVKEQDGVYLGKNTKIDAMMDYPALTTYYALNNMLASFTEDVSLSENVTGLQRMGQVGSMGDVYNVVEALVEGEEYQRDKNAGRKKGAVLLENYVIPSTVSLLGFGKKMEKDYNAIGIVDRFLATNLEKLEVFQKEAKKEAKKVEGVRLKDERAYKTLSKEGQRKWLSNKLTQFSKNNYPTLKVNDFRKDGTLNSGGADKIRNYKEALPKGLLKVLYRKKK